MKNKLPLILSSAVFAFTSGVLPATAQPNIGNLITGMDGELVAQAQTSRWVCVANYGDRVAEVTIDWGHTVEDATWACNNWRSVCLGECWAVKFEDYKDTGEGVPLGSCNPFREAWEHCTR